MSDLGGEIKLGSMLFTMVEKDLRFGEEPDLFGGRDLGQMLWTAPFIPTIPGTDTYTDELW